MRRIIAIATFLFCTASLQAQQPQLPQSKTKLPDPGKLRPLAPPDLRVEELSFVSVTRDAANKKINIQVLIRVKNVGGVRCGPSTVVAYMKIPAGSASTRTLTTSLPISDINPGASFVKVFTFREPEAIFRPGNCEFWIKADGRNLVTESDESNNLSPVITIAVPAR